MTPPFAADGIRPGQWKITSVVVNNGRKLPPRTSVRCLTEEQASDLADTFSPRFGGVNTTCKRTQNAKAKHKLTWRLQCRGQLKIDSVAEFTFFSSLRYAANVSTKGWIGGRQIMDSQVRKGNISGPADSNGGQPRVIIRFGGEEASSQDDGTVGRKSCMPSSEAIPARAPKSFSTCRSATRRDRTAGPGYPRFVGFNRVRTPEGGFTFSIFQGKASTDESVRVAPDRIAKNGGNTGAAPPVISEGTVVLDVR